MILNNEESVCNVWFRRLLENWSESTLMIKPKHLKTILLPGFHEFISSNQNILFLSNALNQLAKDFEEVIGIGSCSGASDEQVPSNTERQKLLAKQIQNAVYFFQDAIDSILKLQNIPPHWIFALDNEIRSAVQSAVNLLYKDFKHLFNIDDIDSVSAENLSATIYNRQGSCLTNFERSISHQSFEEDVQFSRQVKEQFRSELKQLIQENQNTVKTLSDTFAEYLQEQNQLFRNLCDQVSHAKALFNSNSNCQPSPVISTTTKMEDEDSPLTGDLAMVSFLQNENIAQSTIDKVKQL